MITIGKVTWLLCETLSFVACIICIPAPTSNNRTISTPVEGEGVNKEIKTASTKLDCFSYNKDNASSGVLENVTELEGTDLLEQFKHHGCPGTLEQSEDQLRMLDCCYQLKSLSDGVNSEPTFGRFDKICSNLNLLSITQMICYQLKQNEPKIEDEFRNLLASEETKIILGRVPYITFHKTMVALVSQHALRLILRVEAQLGFPDQQQAGSDLRNVRCLF